MNSTAITTGTEVTITTRQRRFGVGFPGWGVEGCEAFLLPIDPAAVATVTRLESHGMAPFTRLSVRFADGSTAHGIDPRDCSVVG